MATHEARDAARLADRQLALLHGALVEAAYLSNDAEARRVATPEFRQQIAESLAEHRAVMLALESRNPELTARLMREHFTNGLAAATTR